MFNKYESCIIKNKPEDVKTDENRVFKMKAFCK